MPRSPSASEQQEAQQREEEQPIDFNALGPTAGNPPLKAARAACYSARDAYYTCEDTQGTSTGSQENAGGAQEGRNDRRTITEQRGQACIKQREAFEAACKASWVRYFDQLKEKESRVYRRIQQNIRESGTRDTTVGDLQGRT
jgi:hypothetical protein